MKVIELRGIGKRYQMNQHQRLLHREILRAVTRRKTETWDFWALRGIDLEIHAGESVAIIGENGAGKSTLLKLMSNVAAPTEGEITIRGRLASLLELGAGFHPLLTGRENAYLNGSILGFDKEFIDSKFDDIVQFAGIEKFIDQPVKGYSSGMHIRLGFAIASQLDPDILIVDEVLAVGDEEFQRHCKEWIHSYLASGRTLILVTHDLSLARDLCRRVVWIKDGIIHGEGEIDQVTSDYIMYVSRKFGITTLEEGPLSVIFEKGKLILFWKGIELTKNQCGHSMLMAANSWHVSREARWEIVASDSRHLEALGTFKLIPVRQRWIVDLVGEREIRWVVETEVLNDLSVKNDVVTLMLAEPYRHWFTPREEGEFPLKFDERFGTRIIGVGVEEGMVGARVPEDFPVRLPSVSFENQSGSETFLPQVTNTDGHQRARTLDFSRIKETNEYKAGQTHRFEGVIRLED